MMSYYIGADLGTTAVKVVLFDETGAVVKEASRELSLLYPAPDQIEQSPDCWYEIPCQLIREVCCEIDSDAVKAISISSAYTGNARVNCLNASIVVSTFVISYWEVAG